jgi:hypothetical protein
MLCEQLVIEHIYLLQWLCEVLMWPTLFFVNEL